LSTKVERLQIQIEWRRNKVAELDSQGHSQPEIARILQVSIGIVNRDLSILRQQAKENIKKYIDERLPEEYEKCLVGLNAITKEAWNTAHDPEYKKEKIQALSLAKECYSMSKIFYIFDHFRIFKRFHYPFDGLGSFFNFIK
jgi:RecG-like helicase